MQFCAILLDQFCASVCLSVTSCSTAKTVRDRPVVSEKLPGP